MGRHRHIERLNETVGVEGEGIGAGEQIAVGSPGQHGGQTVLLHPGGCYFPGGWL